MMKLGDNLIEKTEALSGDEAGRVEDEDEDMEEEDDDAANYVIEMEDHQTSHHDEELERKNWF